MSRASIPHDSQTRFQDPGPEGAVDRRHLGQPSRWHLVIVRPRPGYPSEPQRSREGTSEMGKTSKRLGIVATAMIACAGIMTVAAPVAEAKTVSKTEWAKGFCTAVQDWQDTHHQGAHPGRRRRDERRGHLAGGQVEPEEDRLGARRAGKGSSAAAKELKDAGRPRRRRRRPGSPPRSRPRSATPPRCSSTPRRPSPRHPPQRRSTRPR